MISTEVQRTLVKSPPELWSELSDEAALARHLSGFGAVRITGLAAEERVEWEADRVRGSIRIKPSGWGTRVTLTLERGDDATADRPAAPTPRITPAAPEPTALEPAIPDRVVADAAREAAAADRAAPDAAPKRAAAADAGGAPQPR